MSDFGQLPFNGYDQTDESDLQRITYTSTFDNFEVNYRNRWMAPTARYQGSWLVGVRYFKLREGFNYHTESDVTNGLAANRDVMDYDIISHNSLTGAQIGGDMWVCLLPGLRIGGEVKAGVYGNHMVVNSTINTSNLGQTFTENLKQNDVAFVGNLDAYMTYRLNYQWTLKLGYQFLYVDGVALAGENFNEVPPDIFVPPPGVSRVAQVNDNGSLFYHGFSAGLEFMW